MSGSPTASRLEGTRVIGALGATAIVAGSMLGVGIFLTPRLVAEQVPSAGAFLLLWILGGVVALAGAVAYAELGTMIPKAGGDYVYLRHTFGPSVGFASGWLLFAGVFCGSISSMAVAISQYQLPLLLAPFTEFDLSHTLLGSWTGTQFAAIGLVVLITGLNSAGVRPSTLLQTLVTLVPFGTLTAVALYILGAPSVPAAVAMTENAKAVSPMGVTTGFLGVYFAYAGWNAVAYVGGEIDRPERNLPLSLLLGTGLVTLLYLLLCGAFVKVLGLEGLRESFEAGTATAATLWGEGTAWFVAVLIAIALLGSINATVLQGSRIAYAMSKDGALHEALGQLSPGTRVPTRALWAQALVSCLLVVTGAFESLVELTSIAMFVMGGLTVVSLFVLRRREPERPRPYRATGYPWLPSLYLLASCLVVGLRLWNAWAAPGDTSSLRAWFPLLGLGLFGGMLLGHSLWRYSRHET